MAEDEDQAQRPTNGVAAALAIGFNLPEPILAVLPADPFDQLDVARKITSIALSKRLSILEDEIDGLRENIADRDDIIADLRAQLDSLDSVLGDLSGQLARVQEEKEALLNENASLTNTVNKLNRDVSKLEVFKKALMQSLQEESGSPVEASKMAQMQISKTSTLPSASPLEEEESSNPPPKLPSPSETGFANSNDGDLRDMDASKSVTLRGLDLPLYGGTPRLTPPGSPPRFATGLTPKRLSRPISPRRHSVSVTTTRNAFDNRSGIFSPIPPTQPNSITSPFETGEQPSRPRVDGKEFFRQVRSRLSYEQFSAFLSNVKELNSQKQTRAVFLVVQICQGIKVPSKAIDDPTCEFQLVWENQSARCLAIVFGLARICNILPNVVQICLAMSLFKNK